MIVDAARRSGLKVSALAPSWVAADEPTKSTGVDAQAIAKWRFDRTRGQGQALDEKTLILVDEAGMTGTRELSAILVAAKEAGAKSVLLGDRRQLAAVPGGCIGRCSAPYSRASYGRRSSGRGRPSVVMARGAAEAGLRAYVARDRALFVEGADAPARVRSRSGATSALVTARTC